MKNIHLVKSLKDILTKKNENIKFTIILSILIYFSSIFSTNIFYLKSSIMSNTKEFLILSIIDFILNFLCLLLFSFINKFCVYLYTIFTFILNSINYWTITITNKRFLITDLLLTKTVVNNLKEVHLSLYSIFYFILLLLIYILIIKFIKKNIYHKTNIQYKIFFVGLTFIMIIEMFSYFYSNSSIKYRVEIKPYLYSNIFYNLEEFEYLKKPNDYNKNLNKIKELQNKEKISENTSSPIIIQIMSEALMDFDNINYMPFTKSLESGKVQTNIWGNKTVVSEFESLTGISTNTLKINSANPYTLIKNKNIDSIISTAKNNGYKTIGIHPYLGKSYQRNKYWNYLGFDEMYFIENFNNPTYVRNYISDESFFDKIIETIHKNENTPLYIYGISMQNHATFTNEDFKSTINVGTDELNQYVSLENITDKSFENFIKKLENENREVILLYYGDHQPMLSNTSYKNLNVSDKYEVPYVLWSNKKKLTCPNKIQMCQLPLLLLKNSNLSLSGWFNYLNELEKTDDDFINNSLYKSWCYYQLKNI